MVELEYKSGSAAWYFTIRTQCFPARGANHVWYKLHIGIDVSQQFTEIKLRGRRRWKWERRESRGKQRKREGERGQEERQVETLFNK